MSSGTSNGRLLATASDGDAGRTHAWRGAVLIVVLGLMTTGSIAWWTVDRAQVESDTQLAEDGQLLADSVAAALDEVVERLTAVGSLYLSSEDVTQDEFRLFTANFGRIPGMGGIGYMPIVAADELAEFESEMRQTIPDYEVWEFDDEGNRVPVSARSSYVPVEWFEPANAFGRPHGFDSTSEPNRRTALNRARTEKDSTVTAFLQLVSETDPDGFLVYWPVIDPGTREVFGYTVAPMDLSELLDGQVSTTLSEGLTWDIDVLSSGRRPVSGPDHSWATNIDVGASWWALTVTRADGATMSPNNAELSLVIVAGVLITVIAAFGFHFYIVKSAAQQELDQLRRLTRAKDQFLASVSHELRTPLTGVLGFAELLRDSDDELDDEERRAMISNVADEASDLAAIIEDLLVAARSELDLLAITRVPVSLRAQVAQVLESIDVDSRSRIVVDAEAEPISTAAGDPGRVRQIIRNLVTNANRYGGRRIVIRFRGDDGHVHLEVADDGPGLPVKEWEQIFEAYYRAHDSSTQPAGIGIGLSVARHLARLMGGDLSYRWEEGWSIFRLTLPALAAEAEHVMEHRVSTARSG